MNSSLVTAECRPLHKYLRERFANVVVLTFTQIEDLQGAPLPEEARQQAGWWTAGETDGVATSQSVAWIQAARTAVPDMAARKVTFERRS